MGQLLLLLLVALVVGAVVFAVAVLITGDDPGLEEAAPDGRSVPFPATRPLVEGDVSALRFDTAIRGYRMGQVDAALRRAAYDLGYKQELIQVLEAEVVALREGRVEDADALRRAREVAAGGSTGDAPRDAEIDLGMMADDAPADHPLRDHPGQAGDADEASAHAAEFDGDDPGADDLPHGDLPHGDLPHGDLPHGDLPHGDPPRDDPRAPAEHGATESGGATVQR